MSELLSTASAARLVGLTPASFRRAVNRSETLRAARVMLDGRTPAYPRDVVEQWQQTRRRAC